MSKLFYYDSLCELHVTDGRFDDYAMQSTSSAAFIENMF